MNKPTDVNIQLSTRKWVQVTYTSPTSATIFFYNKKKETINGMGGPLFNVKIIDNDWQLNIVPKPDIAKKIWPKIKKQMAFQHLAQQLSNLSE